LTTAGKLGRLVAGDRWIGGRQHRLADRFERDALVVAQKEKFVL
jgi:hypothetical protein